MTYEEYRNIDFGGHMVPAGFGLNGIIPFENIVEEMITMRLYDSRCCPY